MKSYLAIDTSITACGIALYVDTGHLTFGTLRPIKEGTMEDRAENLWDKVTSFTKNEYIDYALIEMPTFQESNKGVVAATSGGLIKLAFTAGYLAARLYPKAYDVRLITPPQWKGMVSKDQTRERILRHSLLGPHLNGFDFDHNASDAIGMIAWALEDKPKMDLSKAMIVKL
jgi:hypothetical protein